VEKKEEKEKREGERERGREGRGCEKTTTHYISAQAGIHLPLT
jgi:hypothetical protein